MQAGVARPVANRLSTRHGALDATSRLPDGLNTDVADHTTTAVPTRGGTHASRVAAPGGGAREPRAGGARASGDGARAPGDGARPPADRDRRRQTRPVQGSAF